MIEFVVKQGNSYVYAIAERENGVGLVKFCDDKIEEAIDKEDQLIVSYQIVTALDNTEEIDARWLDDIDPFEAICNYVNVIIGEKILLGNKFY